MSESQPARRVIYHGLKIDVALQTVPLPDGTTMEREIVVHRGAVALVPMVDQSHVCLVRNRRFAVNKTLLEVPAGTIDAGESPAETAARELKEETGYRAGRIRHIRDWYVSPGVMTERMYLFVCEDLEPGPAEHDVGEELETLVVPWAEAMAMVEDGRIEDAKTMIALIICDQLRA